MSSNEQYAKVDPDMESVVERPASDIHCMLHATVWIG